MTDQAAEVPVEGDPSELETKKPKRSKSVKKKGKAKVPTGGKRKVAKKITRGKKKTKPVYNTDVHPDTGVMQLQELLYYRLITAEQNVKIMERDVHIAKSQAKDFQTSANQQLMVLQEKIKERVNGLEKAKAFHYQTVNAIEKETGLTLKDWAIDDERVLRPLKGESS